MTVRIEGWASLYDVVDNDSDLVSPGAFDDSLKIRSRIPMLFNHDPSRPCGVWKSVTSKDKGLWVVGEVTDPDLKRPLLDKSLFGLSIGYNTKLSSKDNGIRRLLKVDLIELSIVSVPMCYGCHITKTLDWTR